jgi:hypothetical protein
MIFAWLQEDRERNCVQETKDYVKGTNDQSQKYGNKFEHRVEYFIGKLGRYKS